jgi:hypothetical protein
MTSEEINDVSTRRATMDILSGIALFAVAAAALVAGFYVLKPEK